jgi:hexosaminidase
MNTSRRRPSSADTMTLSLIPNPSVLDEQPGNVSLPSSLGITGNDVAMQAVRPLLRTLEDCGAIQQWSRADDGFVTIEINDLDDEAYSLRIEDDRIMLSGSDRGVRHGVQTLLALLPSGCLMPGSGARAILPKVSIADAPRLGWRGLLIDVARHYMPVSWLRTVVEMLAFHKLNVLHLHLTDDQGWRMPIDAFPKLTTVGARRRETLSGPAPGNTFDGRAHGGAYTKEELRSLVAFARERGVMVVPEIDLPGHMVAAISAYPEWGNASDPLDVLTTWGISSDIINVRPETVDALRTILDEVMDVFDSPFIHIGGDEVPTRDWESSAEVAELMEREGISEIQHVQGWLMTQLVEHLKAAGRTPIVWDEAVEAGIGTDVMVQGWRSPEAIDAAIAAGHPTIASPQQHWYLNYSNTLGEDEPLGYGVGKNIATSLEEAFAYRVPDRATGVEAALWAEYVKTPEKASFQLLPRLAAVAERAWAGNNLTFDEFLPSVRAQLERYEALGWAHRPLDGPGPRWSRTLEKGGDDD